MAFNFNWHPLTADSDFYSRARDLLTTALNKSPKPPIIVSDILVTELNLGNTPPELEILEIGDLADDRFRGIFKMQYSGDAYLTLQTKVQANPLNTYLSTAPSFTNPMPLAASSPLTIPIQITLSQFRLSGFVILVFSKAKGVTLVFRNDPLESLVVSSTFDSIPFIKDYLQQEIEKQLRNLFQDELPAIIHRLSLQWCGNEYDTASGSTVKSPKIPEEPQFEPRHSLSPASSFENLAESAQESATPFIYGNDPEGDTLSSKNLLRLATLMDSQKTLSLFTPSIRDAVYRAWATTGDRSDPTSTPAGTTSTTYTFDSNGNRPGLVSIASSLSISSTATGLGQNGRPVTRSSPHGKKKKTRVVNLRRTKTSPADSDDTSSVAGSTATDSSSLLLENMSQDNYSEEDTGEVRSPPISPPREPYHSPQRTPTRRNVSYSDRVDHEENEQTLQTNDESLNEPLHHASNKARKARVTSPESRLPMMQPIPEKPTLVRSPTSDFGGPARFFNHSRENSGSFFPPVSTLDYNSPRRSLHRSSTSIAERALLMKVAGEMARRMTDERVLREKAEEMFDEERLRARSADSPPPAYKVQEY